MLTVRVASPSSTTRIQMRAAASAVSMARRTRIQTTTPAIFRPPPPRTLSSMGSMMSTPIPTPAPIVHMSMKPPRIVSRRAWQQQKQQQQQQQQRHGGDAAGKKDQAKTATAAAAAAEKPWPASVRYTAYVAAVTVIPYMAAWMITYNPTLRSLALKEHEVLDENNNKKSNKNNTLQDYLRWQFGTEDEEEAQTTTRNEDDDALLIPKQFPNELPYSIRAAQAAIRALEKQTISVRIGILTDSSNIENNTHQPQAAAAATATNGMSGPCTASLGDMQADDTAAYYYHILPGSTPARIDAIIMAMKSSTAATTTSDNIASRNSPAFPPPFLSSLSLDFEDVPAQTKTNDAMPTTTAEMNDDDDDKEIQQESTLATKKQQKQKHNTDPLLKQTSCFSLWHYQDAAILQAQVQQQQEKNASNNKNNLHRHHDDNTHSIELARLEFQVQQFQDELNNAASSLRAVDDIRHDLQESKAALKRLQRVGNNKSWWSSLW